MKRDKKRMAAALAILSAVTLLAGCGKKKNDAPGATGVGYATGYIAPGVPGVPGWNGQPIGSQCGTINPSSTTTLGFTAVMPGYASAGQQYAVFNSPYGQVAGAQVQVTGGGGGQVQVNGVITITPQGAQILLAEAGIYNGQSVNVCAQMISPYQGGLTLTPLRGGVYLQGLPLPRSGLPHLVFTPAQ